MRNSTKLAIGVILAAAAVGAYVVRSRAARWSERPIASLTPIDAQRAIVTQRDDAGGIRLSLVDGAGRAAWAHVIAYRGLAHAAVGSGAEIVALDDAMGFDLRDGRERWRRGKPAGLADDGLAVAHLDRGQLLVVDAGNPKPVAMAIDAASGRDIWRAQPDVGEIAFYRLLEDTLLLAGEGVAIVDRRTGAVADMPSPKAARNLMCSLGARTYVVTKLGELVRIDQTARTSEVIGPDVGRALCPKACWALACATHGDEIILAANESAGSAALPTTVRLAGFAAATGATRWTLELPAPGQVHARSELGFKDFVPLRGEAPRFVPFRVGTDLVIVDLDQHEIATRQPGRSAEHSGWALRSDAGVYYAHDYGTLGVFDGARGTLAASVRATVGRFAVGGDRVWVFGTSYDEASKNRIGQLDARTLKPLPGSEHVVEERVEGAWPAKSGWWGAK